MRVDITTGKSWDLARQDLAGKIPFANGLSVLPSKNLYLAAFENLLALAQLYSFKKCVAVVKGNSPLPDALAAWFLREAFQVQTTTWSALGNRDAVQAWVQGLKKDTLFVITADDHPFTGEISGGEVLDELLNQQKIFHVRASHSSFLARSEKPRPFSSLAISIHENLALTVLGERQRCNPLFSQHFDWSAPENLNAIATRFQTPKDESAVRAFETAFGTSGLIKEPRLFDRAVVALPIHGEKFIEQLRNECSYILADDLSTANGCFWGRVGAFQKWWENAPSEDVLRGLVAVSARLCAHPGFAADFKRVHDSVQKGQTW